MEKAMETAMNAAKNTGKSMEGAVRWWLDYLVMIQASKCDNIDKTLEVLGTADTHNNNNPNVLGTT